MKVFLASIVATFSLGISAFADDLSPRLPTQKYAPSGWTGFYLGANAGYGWQNSNGSVTAGDPNTAIVFAGQINVPSAASSFNSSGALGGIQTGYSWQFDPNWVAGIEADFDWSDIKGNGSAPTTIAFGATPATFSASQNIEWFGTVRARLGYLSSDNLLLFGTSGFAYGSIRESANLVLPAGASNSTGNFNFGYSCGAFYGSATCFAGSSSRTSVGWTAGGGAEYKISGPVTFKVEYLYVNLGSRSFPSPALIYSNNPSVMNASIDATFSLVRAGLNYRF